MISRPNARSFGSEEVRIAIYMTPIRINKIPMNIHVEKIVLVIGNPAILHHSIISHFGAGICGHPDSDAMADCSAGRKMRKAERNINM